MEMRHLRTPFHLSIPMCLLLTILLAVPALTVRSAPAGAAAATIVVDTEADELDGSPGNGDCSLREAITNANNDSGDQADCAAGSGADTITLPAGTYTLTGAAGEDGNASGDLDITGILTINGTGATRPIIQAGTSLPVGGSVCGDCVDRVLHIRSGATVEINSVMIRYGRTADGASGASGTAGDPGGGIYNYQATLTLNDCNVSYNRTGDGGDGSASFGGAGGLGGGIFSFGGTLILNDTVVRNNETGAGGDSGPSAPGFQGGSGGGIYLFFSGVMTLTNSVVSNNATGDGGAGGDATGGDAAGGSGGCGGSGAGIYAAYSATSLAVIGSTISDNETGLGGSGGAGSGTGFDGPDGVRGSGGGLYALQDAHAALRDSTIRDNTALVGGGIDYESGAIVTLVNCTLSGNRAYMDGGGIYNTSEATATLAHVTIANNTADLDDNGSGAGGGVRTSGTFTMTNTIVAKNIDKGGENPDCYGTVISGDYNLLGIGDSVDCTFTPQAKDQVGTTVSPIDPLLGPLGDKGGPTWTHSLNLSSPAANQIPAGVNGCVLGIRDQRGVLRFPPCSIGAYEPDHVEEIHLPLVLR